MIKMFKMTVWEKFGATPRGQTAFLSERQPGASEGVHNVRGRVANLGQLSSATKRACRIGRLTSARKHSKESPAARDNSESAEID